MDLDLAQKPREFQVGKNKHITMKAMGYVYLEPDEQITLMTSEKQEYDVCRKSWGYYATPSINARLKRFGFKTALVKNGQGQMYVMLVLSQKTEEFLNYVRSEEQEIVCWLDDNCTQDLTKIGHDSHFVSARHPEAQGSKIEQKNDVFCPICTSNHTDILKRYTCPPVGENNFDIANYQRDLCQCLFCDHIFNQHTHPLSDLYSADYCDRVYRDKIKEIFQKIISLPPDQSDNHARVQRVRTFVQRNFSKPDMHILDIGSGLCVFLYQLKQATGWHCVALDPDPRQAQHARDVCGVAVINESILDYTPETDKNFDLITLNKVLEHFEDPLHVLKRIKGFFNAEKPGYLYLEVPDGEMAILDSLEREEFFIEHYHAFSYQSIQMLLKHSGWCMMVEERIREPSGKYTIYCFARSH